MHENRETCSAPVNQTGRSEKAQSQTADAYALQESDRCVLPVKQSNKEGQPSAEAAAQGERRAIQHQSDTERGTGVPGIERRAPSGAGKEARAVHCFDASCDGKSTTG